MTGVDVGNQVADWALARYFRPARGDRHHDH
jgi:hypothetical protein